MARPDARSDVPAERAADLLYALLSPELFIVFVQDRGWSPDAWEEWVNATLHDQLLAFPGSAAAVP
jgi:hypothetical protein